MKDFKKNAMPVRSAQAVVISSANAGFKKNILIHYVDFKGGIRGITSLPRPSGGPRGVERSGAPREDPEGGT
jgi:hypothetical protein